MRWCEGDRCGGVRGIGAVVRGRWIGAVIPLSIPSRCYVA